jgi:hypothetical protein
MQERPATPDLDIVAMRPQAQNGAKLIREKTTHRRRPSNGNTSANPD